MGLLDRAGGPSPPAASAMTSSSALPTSSSAKGASSSPHTAPQPPTRTTRAICWAARDAFFACLDTHSILDPLSPDASIRERTASKCGDLDASFGRECADSWVTYFKQRRVMEFRKKETLEKLQAQGAERVDADPDAGVAGVAAAAGGTGTYLPSAVAASSSPSSSSLPTSKRRKKAEESGEGGAS